ncbi:hypothetical protein [Acidovorax sp. SUPP3334]|uniref:hypothetical protein n=1 Tax=Acidovorax sp. SUPP3334 TaxID=2920881 RepID=UPI0023DE3CBC|nr:hypothetical protein [Acidovorax sp. SUPP3334]GKT26036.1 hypothetical protein AVHM3334_19860 [Acidovorax sp. SUPP3334]
MISDELPWVKRFTDFQVCRFVADAPSTALESYGLMVSALREQHAPMTVRDSEINLDDAIGKELITFALPDGFAVTDAGRFLVMTASTGARARSILDQIEDEK